ncbi:MAG: Gfo/Idh/MocA family oxidoreductase [Verrucomicrobiota bacterium]
MSAESTKLKFAVVGCGRVSGNHLAALSSGLIPAEVVAVADVAEEKAHGKGERHHVPHYADFHEMARRHPEVDVFDVLTPTGYHAQHVIDLAGYGKHIVVEKPMALTVADCDAMMDACRKHKCRLFVVKQNRFNRAIVAARRALEEGRFGKLVLGTVRVRWSRDQKYYEQDDWHGTWALDGGVMAQQASHHLDLLQWFMGPVDTMQCQIATRLLDIEVEDTAVAIMKFTSGALGAFEATVATRPKDLEGSLSLLGEKGSVMIGGHAVNHILHWQFLEERPEDAGIRDEHSEQVPNVYGHGHIPYLGNVADAILHDKPGLVEAEEGKRNIAILTALYESAAAGGQTVHPGCPIKHSKLGRP